MENISTNKDFSSDDLVVLSFSGHGVSDAKGNGYILPIDWQSDDMFNSAIPVSFITAWLKDLNIKRSLVMMDACREQISSGKAISSINRLYEPKFEAAQVSAVFYATKKGGFSYEDPDSHFGIFTKYVLQGLGGKGDGNANGVVTFRELQTYVEDELTQWAMTKGYNQRPYIRLLDEQSGDLALTVASIDDSVPYYLKKQAVPLSGEKQETHLKDIDLIYNGSGTRDFLFMDFYTCTLYLEKESHDAHHVIHSDQSKRLVLNFIRGISGDKVATALLDSIYKNYTGNIHSIKPQLFRLRSYLPKPIYEGDSLIFTYCPGIGTEIVVNGEIKGVIEGVDFMEALFSCWFGDDPPTESLKKGLLGMN